MLPNVLPDHNDLQLYEDLNDLLELHAEPKHYMTSGYLETLERHKERQRANGNGFGYVVVVISKIKFEIDNSLPLNSLESRIENFKNRIANKQVDVIEYADSYSKVTLKCHVCGNTFSKSYNAMLKHSECPHCNPSTTPKTAKNPKAPKISAEEQQLNRSQKYFDKLSVNSAGKVSVLTYNGAKEKLVAHCNECGHEWSIRADHLLARAYCPICRKTK